MQQDQILSQTGADGLNQFLTFTLGNEEYGIEILKVQEIKGYSGITPIPNTPPHIKGIMNLRGTVVPVLDLRVKFAMEPREYDKFTVIILVTVGQKIVGLIVDTVSDVLDVADAQIRSAPDLGPRVDIHFINGMASLGEKFIVLLDVAKLLSADELSEIARAA